MTRYGNIIRGSGPATRTPSGGTYNPASTNAPSAMAKGAGIRRVSYDRIKQAFLGFQRIQGLAYQAPEALGDMDLRRKRFRIPFTRVEPRQLSNAQLAMFNANGVNIRPMDGSPGAPRSYDEYLRQFPAEFRGGDGTDGKPVSQQPWTQAALDAWFGKRKAKYESEITAKKMSPAGWTPSRLSQHLGGKGATRDTREFMGRAKAEGMTQAKPTVDFDGNTRSWDVPPPPASTAANFKPRTFGRY